MPRAKCLSSSAESTIRVMVLRSSSERNFFRIRPGNRLRPPPPGCRMHFRLPQARFQNLESPLYGTSERNAWPNASAADFFTCSVSSGNFFFALAPNFLGQTTFPEVVNTNQCTELLLGIFISPLLQDLK